MPRAKLYGTAYQGGVGYGKQVELLLESCFELQGQQTSTLTPSARVGSHINPRWAKPKKKTRQKEQPAEP
jgi:hypothetical protein